MNTTPSGLQYEDTTLGQGDIANDLGTVSDPGRLGKLGSDAVEFVNCHDTFPIAAFRRIVRMHTPHPI